MAIGGLDLGDVGFSLTADTAGLEKALSVLRAFGQEVNKYERKTDEASQKATAAYMRQERAMVSLYQKMTNLQSAARRSEAPSVITANATKSLQGYIDKLVETDKHGKVVQRSQLEMQRATAAAAAEYNKVANSLKNWQVQSRNATAAQQALANASKQATTLLATIGRKGGPEELVTRTTAAMQQLESVLQKPKAKISEIRAAVNAYNAEINKVTNSLKGWEVQEKALQAAQKQQQAVQSASQNALLRAQSRVDALIAGGKRSFVPDTILGGYSAALTQFEAKVKSGALSARELSRAQTELSASLTRVTQKVRDYVASQNASNQAEMLAARATQRVRRINESALAFNVPQGIIRQNASNLQVYQQALFTGDRAGAAAALTTLNQGLLKTQTILAGSTDKAQKFSSALRGMERATILAMGPLSGLGARMAVMAALFESMTVKSALAIAGFTAIGTSITMLAVAGIKARMEFERWNSGLIAASGSAALVAGEMDYLIATAEKYGQSIRVLAPAYVSFGTSARLANVSLKEQRDIFESFTIAGAALHWTTEQTQRAFLALEQMMSKGVVQTQEMKLQLGQVLPGAMEIAAMSIGKTTKEFMKMMEQGEVISSEMLPKFAEKVKQVFEAASKYGAQALQADINRFDTNKLFAAEALDRAIKASVAFQATLREINQLLVWVKDNADKAFAGFVAGAAMIVTFYLPAILAGMVKLIAHLRTMTILSALFTAATPLGWVKGLAALVTVAGVGVGTYALLTRRTSEAAEKTQDLINKTAIAIGQYEVLGSISKREKEAHLEALDEGIRLAKERIEFLQKQTDATIAVAKATLSAAEAQEILNKANTGILGKDPKKMGFFETWGRTLGASQTPVPMGTVQKQAEDAKKAWEANTPAARAQAEIDMLRKNLEQLEKNRAKLAEMKETQTATGNAGEDAGKKLQSAYESAYNSVHKLVTEFTRLKQTQSAINAGNFNDLSLIEAQKKVADFFEGMKDKTKSQVIAKLSKDYANIFAAAGIEGKTFEEKLVNLVMKTEQLSESTNKWMDALRNLPQARQEMEDMTKAIEGQVRVLQAKLEGGDTKADAVKRAIEREQAIKDAMEKFWSNDVDLIDIAGAADRWNAYKQKLDEAFKLEDIFADMDMLKQQYEDVMSVISAAEESMQSKVVTGLETESSARLKLMDLYKQQGDSLNKDLVPQLREMMLILQDPKAVANLQAIIDKIAELQEQGRAKTFMEGVQDAIKEYTNAVVDHYKIAHDKTTEFLKSMEQSLADFLFDPWEKGIDGMLLSFGNAIKRMIAEAVAADLMRRIMGNFNPSDIGTAVPSLPGSDQNLLGSFFSLFGFASGGSFTVQGSGGTDSQLVAFMATPGEKVSVTTPPQQRALENSGKGSQNFNFYLPGISNSEEARKASGHLQRAVIGALKGAERYR